MQRTTTSLRHRRRSTNMSVADFPMPATTSTRPWPSRALLALVFCWLAGCVPYPIYKTLQPSAKATVVDASNNPIADAKVTLIANAYPYGREKSRATEATDENGMARFPAVREWRIESLMIHGADVFFWNWCIQKPGFTTFQTSHRGAKEFEANVTIKLQKGESQPCAPSLEGSVNVRSFPQQ